MTTRTTAVLVSVVATAAALLSVTPAASARPAPRPDLTVTTVTAPAAVRQGGTLAVTTVVRNAGRAPARSSAVRFVLSRDARLGNDRSLRATRSVPRLRAARTSRATTRITVPATIPVGAWYVIACADGGRRVRESKESNNCRAGRRVSVTVRPSSEERIEADVAAGRITAHQGLLYRVFSDFKDRRLPARYAGAASGLGDGALGAVTDAWGTLPRAIQDQVRPFLVPPMYAGSHWSPAAADAAPAGRAISPWCSGENGSSPLFQSWDFADNADGTVRIWWLQDHPGDAVTAGHLLQELDDKILPALTSLMGRGPRPDGGGVCDGGSAALDVSLVDARTANVVADNTSCGQAGTTTHLVFPRTAAGAGWSGLDPYLAHEVMHTIQFALPVAGSCRQYSWLREMTAQWVQDYVTDPSFGIGVAPDDTEWGAAALFLDHPGTPLDAEAPPVHHDYGAYLLPFWAARQYGAGVVRTIWDNAATKAPTEAVDASLPGGFEALWDDFALANWNRGPVKDYREWDGLNRGAAAIGPHHVPRGSTNPAVLASHLTAKYLDLTWAKGVREIQVTNDKAGDPKLHLQAVITYDDGTEKVQDLSATQVNHLCVDDGTRTATRVTLVFSNADLTADATFRPGLEGLDTCSCDTSSQPRGAARAAAPVCAVLSLTYTETEDWVWHEGQERWGRGSSRETASLTLDLVATPGEPGSFESSPASTYTARRDAESEFFRNHTDCDGEGTTVTQGSGALPAGNARGNLVDDEFWLVNLVAMPARAESTHDFCGSVTTDSQDTALAPPECPPQVSGSDPFYEFERTTPTSRTYTFSCAGDATWEDGTGVHDVTVTVSGTITLPE